MTNEQRIEILAKLAEYKHGSGETYENIARELGVTTRTCHRWINSTPKVLLAHLKGIEVFLKSKGLLNLLFLFGVSWVLHFDSGEGFKTVEMFKEFESYKQIEFFIKHAPKENKVFECEHHGERGYCKVSDFKIEEGN